MLIIYLLVLLIILGYTIYLFKDDEPELGLIAGMFLCIPIIGIMTLMHISTGEKTYTGYIYSTEDVLDKTNVHIRFSKDAGKDEQPVFCVKNGTVNSEKFKDLAGSDNKVKIKIPAGFALNMWYGQCPIEAEIIEEK